MVQENSQKYDYEIEVQNFWKKNNIYEKLQEKNKNSKIFSHVDGPPYPTGEIHLGHLRNWSVKDCILRFKRLEGYNVYARDGYDAHGLPVENKVQAKLGLKTVDDLKEFGEANFVKECKKYVKNIISDMTILRERFGLWMDREPYLTYHPKYLSFAWNFFKKAEEQNLLYKDYKTVAWCPHDQTTLSDYEIKDTYKTLEDPSIYIKFEVQEKYQTTKNKEYLIIWTTTPWTLQSNLAIAINPEFNYSRVLVNLNGVEEVFILGTSLIKKIIEKFSKQNKIKLIKILETKKGAEFEGIKYNHIYLDETPSQQEFVKLNSKHIHSVVLADYVTLDEGEDILEKLEKKGYKHESKTKEVSEKLKETTINDKEGTGLVHIAPGHGFDDYEIGKKYNLPIFCPIDKAGIMNEGKYKGKYFKDIDPIAIKYLTEKKIMIYNSTKSHRYPCCWRCKTPIVYRAADQWWIKRSEYTKEIVKKNSNVNWTPKSANVAYNNLISKAGDWAISRQRYWGIPLPIFEDEDGNYEVFGSKEELEKRIGKNLPDIHRDDIKDLVIINKKSKKPMKAVPFIADVWFDSGCASFASHYNEGLDLKEIMKKYYPISWVTEGEDQIRGWFSSLFNVGYVMTGKAPYNSVLFQRFIMDKNGVKMSKSLGNGISGNEAINMYGADIIRYYLLSKILPEEQLNFDESEIKIIQSFFNTLDNVFKFTNSYLEEYSLKELNLNFKTLNVEDKWILYKLNISIQKFRRFLDNSRISTGIKEIEDFLIKDFSKTYLKIIKDRTNERDENLLVIFNYVLKNILKMLSVVIPFKTENLYLKSLLINKKESIFLETELSEDEFIIKEVEKKGINNNFELSQEIIATILNAREKAKIGLRWPLSQVDILSSEKLNLSLKEFEKLIKELTNISKINYTLDDVKIEYIIKPNFMTIKKDFPTKIQDVIKAINLNKFPISEDLKKGESTGFYENLELDLDKHIIKEMKIIGEGTSSDFSKGNIILHTKQDEILLEEGYLRELIRRVQQKRKDLKCDKKDIISISFKGSNEYFLELVKNWSSVISKKVGAKEIVKEDLGNSEEFKIKEKNLIISIKV